MKNELRKFMYSIIVLIMFLGISLFYSDTASANESSIVKLKVAFISLTIFSTMIHRAMNVAME